MDVFDTLLLIGGLYLVVTTQILTTKNWQSAIVFKVVPLLIGALCIFEAASGFV